MRSALPAVSLFFVISSSSEAHAGGFLKKAVGVLTAPVRVPAETAINVVTGKPIPATDVIVVVAPTTAAPIVEAAKARVPGANEAVAVLTTPVNLAVAIKNLRERTEQLEGTLSNANATMEEVRAAAQSTNTAAAAASDLITASNATVAQGQRLIAIATSMLSRIDTSSPDVLEKLRELKELLQIGRALLSDAQQAVQP